MKPLHIASFTGQLQTVRYLISKGAYIDSKIYDGSTPLHFASSSNHIDVVQYLISHGANIECKNNYGATPLFIAFHKRYYKIVKYLLSNGACFDRLLSCQLKYDRSNAHNVIYPK